jgi:TRAP-type C4-dicarboxylate transport system permease small subunit
VSALAAAYGRLVAALALAAAWLLLAMVGLIAANVTIRTLDWGVIAWTDEVSEYGVYAITLLAAPWLLRLGAHVRVDIVVTALRPAAGWTLELVADLIGLGACAVLLWYATAATLESARTGSVTVKSLVFPEWWTLAPLPVCFLLLALEFGFRLHRLASGPHQPRPSTGGGLA